MKIKPFALERYFAKYEFSAKYLLSSSDCDGWMQKDIVAMADDETKELWDNLRLGYTETKGLPQLRKEITGFYKCITHEDVLVVAPAEGIFISLNTLLDKDDHVICPWPAYQSLYQIVEAIGCPWDKWEPNESQGWQFDVDDLQELIKPQTKLIVLNFPHNPTGYLPTPEQFSRIIEIAKENNIYIFSDEMYRYLEHDANNRLPSASDIYDRAVSLCGMSKSFGLAGLRIGWLTTRDNGWQEKMIAYKDYTTICSSAPSEILSLIALRAKDQIIKSNLRIIQRNLTALEEFFGRQRALFSWVQPQAGTIGFPKILFGEGANAFCERVVKDTGIMLLPSTVYGYDNNHFRLGFGRKNMPEALSLLEKYLNKYPLKNL